jgi:hypothetical protein
VNAFWYVFVALSGIAAGYGIGYLSGPGRVTKRNATLDAVGDQRYLSGVRLGWWAGIGRATSPIANDTVQAAFDAGGAAVNGVEVWFDCARCIGQVHAEARDHQTLWVHEDGDPECYAAAGGFGWPNDSDTDPPDGYEDFAARHIPDRGW